MKTSFLTLIDQVDHVKSYFHFNGGNGMPRMNVIFDRTEFIDWKLEVQFELQDIYDRTSDHFIFDLLTLIKQGFEGWDDEKSFAELSAGLLTIKKNIDRYYPAEITESRSVQDASDTTTKPPKVFISHSKNDKDLVLFFVDLLEAIGIRTGQLFCSSVPGYDIPLDSDIYDYLKAQFETYELHVIFLLSKNYYNSAACLNEMGAAWVLHSKYTTILLPGFDFIKIEGAVNPRKIGLKFGDDIADIKDKLGQLKDTLVEEFGLSTIPNSRWEKKRDEFITTVLDSGSKGALAKKGEAQIKDNDSVEEISGSAGKNVTIDKVAEEISRRASIEKLNYSSTSLQGKVRFEYDNNNGEFIIGSDEYSFVTKWGRSGNDSIHAYGAIGFNRSLYDFPNEEELKEMDFSSYSRTIRRGQIVVWRNSHDNFAAIKILSVKSSSHGFPIDEIEFEYKIYH